jgi:alpha-amylase/alpha-mannosidase (GH57 family)
VRAHREAIAAMFGGPPSRGFFPPENAFTPAMVPALVDEGFAWVLVDNQLVRGPRDALRRRRSIGYRA